MGLCRCHLSLYNIAATVQLTMASYAKFRRHAIGLLTCHYIPLIPNKDMLTIIIFIKVVGVFAHE